MKRSVFVTLLVLFILPMVVLPIITKPTGVVMEATIAAPNTQGSIKIPSAGVNASLSLTHFDCDCCYMGLWNGGRINGDAQMFESVKLGDWAEIVMPECHLVLECVELKYSIGQLDKPNGDVLIICGLKVYRFMRL